jgi:hypothetical protein
VDGKKVSRFLVAMGAYWMVFGLITICAPALMDLFQTPEGVAAKTTFSNHVWMHGGFDIVSFSILLFALSRTSASRGMLRAVGLAGLMPTTAITISLVATPYWSPLFVVAGLGCLGFSVGAFLLARSASTGSDAVRAAAV